LPVRVFRRAIHSAAMASEPVGHAVDLLEQRVAAVAGHDHGLTQLGRRGRRDAHVEAEGVAQPGQASGHDESGTEVSRVVAQLGLGGAADPVEPDAFDEGRGVDDPRASARGQAFADRVGELVAHRVEVGGVGRLERKDGDVRRLGRSLGGGGHRRQQRDEGDDDGGQRGTGIDRASRAQTLPPGTGGGRWCRSSGGGAAFGPAHPKRRMVLWRRLR